VSSRERNRDELGGAQQTLAVNTTTLANYLAFLFHSGRAVWIPRSWLEATPSDILGGPYLELDRGIVCGADLNAGAPGVYAAGDVASWPNELFDRRMRVEHWTNAAEQAGHAVRNLLHGTATPFLGSNYVWSDQYGVRIQFLGTLGDEVEVVRGRVEAREFLAWYRDGDRLVGAIAIGLPRALMKTKRLIEERRNWQDGLSALED
jgi:hypothetical protein